MWCERESRACILCLLAAGAQLVAQNSNSQPKKVHGFVETAQVPDCENDQVASNPPQLVTGAPLFSHGLSQRVLACKKPFLARPLSRRGASASRLKTNRPCGASLKQRETASMPRTLQLNRPPVRNGISLEWPRYAVAPESPERVLVSTSCRPGPLRHVHRSLVRTARVQLRQRVSPRTQRGRTCSMIAAGTGGTRAARLHDRLEELAGVRTLAALV